MTFTRSTALRRAAMAIVALIYFTGLTSAVAQTYPNRVIKILVPYAAGGNVDFVARVVAQHLTEVLGQSVIIENKPGGSTNLAADQVARSAPDGYTLFAASRANAINATLIKKLAFDIQKDFVPITVMSDTPNILVVNPDVPAKTVAELVVLAKSQPGKLTFASAGAAGSTHLAGELFQSMAGLDIVHVPYRGGGPASIDLMSGQVTMYFATMPSVMSYVRAGKLRALAVTSAKRSNAEPSYPTMAESGFPGYNETSWVGLMAPAGTPAAIITRLNTEVVRILNRPDVKDKLRAQGTEIVGNSQAEFAAFLKQDIASTANLISKAKLTVVD